jgi:hypothetical protein
MSEAKDASFLASLIKKKATVQQTAHERGLKPIKITALTKEVDRQIQQAASGGDPIKGAGVTKSGGED